MSASKNARLIKLVRKQIADGIEKRESVPSPGTRFHKLGTIFSRATGLIKSGVMSRSDIPVWYSIFKTFPPKYEPYFNRPPLEVNVKDIYYPEDKIRAAIKRWDLIDLKSTTPNATQKLVSTFIERRKTHSDDAALIKDILGSEQRSGSGGYS